MPERDCGRRREVYNVAEAGWRSIDHLAAATTFISISCRASTYILPQVRPASSAPLVGLLADQPALC